MIEFIFCPNFDASGIAKSPSHLAYTTPYYFTVPTSPTICSNNILCFASFLFFLGLWTNIRVAVGHQLPARISTAFIVNMCTLSARLISIINTPYQTPYYGHSADARWQVGFSLYSFRFSYNIFLIV